MALGTALTAATDVSTTAGVQNISLNAGGISAAQALIGSGKLTVFLMSNEYDYGGNEPTSGGDETKIRMWYTEYTGTSRDPRLTIVMDDSSIHTIYAESLGNDDDGEIGNANLDDSVNWTTLRGDENTSAGDGGVTIRSVTSNNSFQGVYSFHAPGRGADVIRDIRRSMFVFNLSGLSGTIDTSTFAFYMDNIGDTGDAGKVIAVQGTALAGGNADYGNCFVADAVTVTHNATFFGANF
jgi:hypothetical protein